MVIPGVLIGPNSLFCFALIACNFEIRAAHRRPLLCCNKQQHKTPRAHQHTSFLVPCAHGKLNVKLYRTTPKPETHITRVVNRKPKVVLFGRFFFLGFSQSKTDFLKSVFWLLKKN